VESQWPFDWQADEYPADIYEPRTHYRNQLEGMGVLKPFTGVAPEYVSRREERFRASRPSRHQRLTTMRPYYLQQAAGSWISTGAEMATRSTSWQRTNTQGSFVLPSLRWVRSSPQTSRQSRPTCKTGTPQTFHRSQLAASPVCRWETGLAPFLTREVWIQPSERPGADHRITGKARLDV
jgi:hypothetical protein